MTPVAGAAPTGLGLEVAGLRVTLGGRQVLDLPRLAVPGGTALAIRGPSGAGKSTLLLALAGLIEAEGRILWDGTDIAALPVARRTAFRRDRIGLVFQDFQLFEELSAGHNAAIAAAWVGDPAGHRARAAAALAALGIADPSRRAATYSGGERQRIAVARALAGNPAAILADEPTASLDRANADRLIADLFGLVRREGRTLIAVSHDPALHRAADRVIDIVDGRLADA